MPEVSTLDTLISFVTTSAYSTELRQSRRFKKFGLFGSDSLGPPCPQGSVLVANVECTLYSINRIAPEAGDMASLPGKSLKKS